MCTITRRTDADPFSIRTTQTWIHCSTACLFVNMRRVVPTKIIIICAAALLLATMMRLALSRPSYSPLASTYDEPGTRFTRDSQTTPLEENARAHASSGKRALFATYTDRASRGLCLSMLSAALQGIDLLVVGVDSDSGFDFSAVRNVKTRKLHAFIELLTNSTLVTKYGLNSGALDLIALVDASDVIYFKSASYITHAYSRLAEEAQQQLHHREHVVLVATERNCWPQMDGKRERIRGGKSFCAKFDDLSSGVRSTYKYPNGGGLLGPPAALAAALADIRAGMESVNQDDQQCTQNAVLRRATEPHSSKPYSFLLDYTSEVFQTGWGSHLETRKYNVEDPHGAYFDERHRVVRNTEHKTEPAFVHFNGGKVAYQDLAKDLLRSFRFSASAREREEFSAIDERYRDRHPSWYDETCSQYVKMVGM